jgi:hypothetical protein
MTFVLVPILLLKIQRADKFFYLLIISVMPARLEEAFGSSYQNIDRRTTLPDVKQSMGAPVDLESSLASLKNPERHKIVHDFSDFTEPEVPSEARPVSRHTAFESFEGQESSFNRQGQCSEFLQHIWSCASCRQKLKDLLHNNNDTQETMPNLIYLILIGLGLIIIFDLVRNFRN